MAQTLHSSPSQHQQKLQSNHIIQGLPLVHNVMTGWLLLFLGTVGLASCSEVSEHVQVGIAHASQTVVGGSQGALKQPEHWHGR